MLAKMDPISHLIITQSGLVVLEVPLWFLPQYSASFTSEIPGAPGPLSKQTLSSFQT